jgi:hypothetical protein
MKASRSSAVFHFLCAALVLALSCTPMRAQTANAQEAYEKLADGTHQQ